MNKKSMLALAVLLASVSGCTDSDCEDGMCVENYGVDPDFVVSREALTAQCSISVQGYGSVAMETDYVPNTTWCENGGAPDQALGAQSAAARTFAYYKISTGGVPVKNSQGDQVYKCPDRTPSEAQLKRCQDATNMTSGYVMTYKGTITAGFYVSGSKGACLNSKCDYTPGASGCSDVSQQKYVTYNWGKSGGKANGFKQTTLGWVDDGNYANRGCMSQNGASCLANIGWEWRDILKYFYGSDINLEKAVGSCVGETVEKKCETKLDKSGTIIDDQDACFTRAASSAWYDVSGGYNNHLYYTYVWDKAEEAVGTWNVNVTRPGSYEVFAYIQSGVGAVSTKAPYKVRASGTTKDVIIDLTGKSGWVSLGKFNFAQGGDQWVKLSDASGEPYTDKNGKRILFDAIKFEDAAPACTNACTEGAKQCSGDGVQTCQKGSNGCTSWSSAVACAGGEKCDGGKCVSSCTNACTEGAKQCAGNGVQTCQKGSNGCTAWSSAGDCGDQKTCNNGVCVDKTVDITCQDECRAGESICDGNVSKVCGQFDDDPCLEFKVNDCGSLTCNDGVCQGAGGGEGDGECRNLCNRGERRCTDNGYIVCSDTNGDGCFEWPSKEITCASDEVCSSGRCVTPGGVPSECLTEVDGRESTILDDQDGCFEKNNSMDWSMLTDFGYADKMYYATVKTGDAVGTWHLNVTKAGKYKISVYVDGGIGKASKKASYIIKASDGEHAIAIDQSESSKWTTLGEFEFVTGTHQYVSLSNDTGESDLRLIYDAIKIEPVDGGSGPAPENMVVTAASDSSCSGLPLGGKTAPELMILCGLMGILVLRRRRESEKK